MSTALRLKNVVQYYQVLLRAFSCAPCIHTPSRPLATKTGKKCGLVNTRNQDYYLPADFKVITGGQTGVDRAGLEVAMHFGTATGGWCPKGRRAMDGRIPMRYRLIETASEDYATRTKINIKKSDATLILAVGKLTGGTLLTWEWAQRINKSVLAINMEQKQGIYQTGIWLAGLNVRVLNIAGPRGRNPSRLLPKRVPFPD